MALLVTGGAGFIGSHLVDRLVEKDKVRVLDNLGTGREDYLNDSVELITGDVRDAKVVEGAVKGCDTVFHLAAQISVIDSIEDPYKDLETNLVGTLNVLKAACKANTKVVFVSTCAVYGEPEGLPVGETHPLHPISPYGASKLAAEKMCEAFGPSYGLETVSLRLFNTYGPRQQSEYAGVISKFLEQALQGTDLTVFGDGEQFRDFFFVEDAVEGIIRAYESESKEKVFNIGTGRKTTVNEVAEAVLNVCGGKVQCEHLPERKGEIRGMQADISLASKELGFEPKVGLEEGINKTYEWLRSVS